MHLFIKYHQLGFSGRKESLWSFVLLNPLKKTMSAGLLK